MTKRMLIDAVHPEEVRVVLADDGRLEEFDFETSTKKQIKGNIYLAKVTRVEPSLQAAFVEYGGNRQGFLPFSEINVDYYQIPVADKELLKAAMVEKSFEEKDLEEDEEEPGAPSLQARAKKPVKKSKKIVTDTIGQDEIAELEEPESDIRPENIEEITEETEEPEEKSSEDNALLSEPKERRGRRRRSRSRRRFGDKKENGEDTAQGSGEGKDAEHGEPEMVGSGAFDDVPKRGTMQRKYKIQEVIKRNQILLVQVIKEERGNKGASLTTYISLAGRYCVLMPNTDRAGGVSRRIGSFEDRKRLKATLEEMKLPEGASVIIRTAGIDRKSAEIVRDYEYLQELWNNIRELTVSSSAPALVYEEGDLIKRSLRDLYDSNIDEILVAGEEAFKSAKKFMKLMMPSHVKKVAAYTDEAPIFWRYQIEDQLAELYENTAKLRSGGSIVINPTEALVSIDVNSGRSTRERNIEETALKTNLEAAREVARQLRLRDLAGLIVIDFIDMFELRNKKAVERALKEALASDRAKIQVGRISSFGLLEMSRQRLRSSLVEANTVTCPRCTGTGHVRSSESTAVMVLRAIESEAHRLQQKRGVRPPRPEGEETEAPRPVEIRIRVPLEVSFYVLNEKRKDLALIETNNHAKVFLTGDHTLSGIQYAFEKFNSDQRSDKPHDHRDNREGRRPENSRRDRQRDDRQRDDRHRDGAREDRQREDRDQDKSRNSTHKHRQREDQREQRAETSLPEAANENGRAPKAQAEPQEVVNTEGLTPAEILNLRIRGKLRKPSANSESKPAHAERQDARDEESESSERGTRERGRGRNQNRNRKRFDENRGENSEERKPRARAETAENQPEQTAEESAAQKEDDSILRGLWKKITQ